MIIEMRKLKKKLINFNTVRDVDDFVFITFYSLFEKKCNCFRTIFFHEKKTVKTNETMISRYEFIY